MAIPEKKQDSTSTLKKTKLARTYKWTKITRKSPKSQMFDDCYRPCSLGAVLHGEYHIPMVSCSPWERCPCSWWRCRGRGWTGWCRGRGHGETSRRSPPLSPRQSSPPAPPRIFRTGSHCPTQNKMTQLIVKKVHKCLVKGLTLANNVGSVQNRAPHCTATKRLTLSYKKIHLVSKKLNVKKAPKMLAHFVLKRLACS